MKIVPDSLFGRLTITLVIALSTAQLLSALAHFYERKDALATTMGNNMAERIIAITKTLEPMSNSQRKDSLPIMNMPPFKVTLRKHPINHRGAEEIQLKNSFKTIKKDKLSIFNQIIIEKLIAKLGNKYLLEFLPLTKTNQNVSGYLHHLIAPTIHQMGFTTTLSLPDKTLLTFTHQPHSHSFSWPWRLIISLSILFVSVVLGVFITVRWLTAPLALLSTAAEKLGNDIEQKPLTEAGPKEVRNAAHAFNKMQAQLQQLIADKTNMFTAISHDLKTPITRLRLRTELLTNIKDQEAFNKDLTEMETMINDSLTFMRGVSTNEQKQLIDINALVESAIDDIPNKQHLVILLGEATKPFYGYPLALKRCLINLLDNAQKYAKNSVAQIDDSNEQLKIIVTDDGGGIPEETIEKIFEPYYRLEKSRNQSSGGTGLGLGISRNIARSHGGDITIQNTENGLQVYVFLKL